MNGFGSVLALSTLGAALAVGAGLLARSWGARQDGHHLVALLGLAGLMLAAALPFAWIRLFGRTP